MTKKQTKYLKKNRILQSKQQSLAPVIDHLHELRRRLLVVVSVVIAGSLAAYTVQEKIVNFLLAPAHNQRFIYTSPGGGINFLFQVCVYFGIVLSIPVIIYQLLRYIEPVIEDRLSKFIYKFSLASAFLAVMGIVFGYYMGLPIALKFLSSQFTNPHIQALFTIQEYMSFVTMYLIGSAFLFQLPLIVLFINRIKPLKPSQLIHFERWVILLAFIVSALMAPTVNLTSQLIIAVPIIAMYQLVIVVIWLQNRLNPKNNPNTFALINKDKDTQAKREVIAGALKPMPQTHGQYMDLIMANK